MQPGKRGLSAFRTHINKAGIFLLSAILLVFTSGLLTNSLTVKANQSDSVDFKWMEDSLQAAAAELGWDQKIYKEFGEHLGETELGPDLDSVLDGINSEAVRYVTQEYDGFRGFLIIWRPEPGTLTEPARVAEWMRPDTSLGMQWIDIIGCIEGNPLTSTKLNEYRALVCNQVVPGQKETFISREVRWTDKETLFFAIQSGFTKGYDPDGDGAIGLADCCPDSPGLLRIDTGGYSGCPDWDFDEVSDIPSIACKGLPVDVQPPISPLAEIGPDSIGPHWPWAETLYYHAQHTYKGGKTYNIDPVIQGINISPEQPNDQEALVISVRANDPDGDALTYQWEIDGIKQSAGGASVTWNQPPAGEHSVTVTVGDGAGGAAQDGRDFTVLEKTLELSVSLACSPSPGVLDEPVACQALVSGARSEEELSFNWYQNTRALGATTEPTIGFTPDVIGDHFISVEVIGENRSASAEVIVTVDYPTDTSLAVAIDFVPDQPVSQTAVVFRATPSNARLDEPIQYRWMLDGSDVAVGGPVWVWESAELGEHVVSVEASQVDQVAQIGAEVIVVEYRAVPVDAGDNAGFKIELGCDNGLTSDDTQECTVRLLRSGSQVGMLDLWWLVNRGTVRTVSTLANSDTWAMETMPPGAYNVIVVATDPLTHLSRTMQTDFSILEGKNVYDPASSLPEAAKIPSAAGGAAAVGSMIAISVWLWSEWYLNWRDRKLPRPRPKWMEDQRPLKEQWREEAEAEASLRGRPDLVYSEEMDCLVEPAGGDPRRQQLLEKAARKMETQAYYNRLAEQLRMQYALERFGAYTDGVVDVANIWFTYVNKLNLLNFSGFSGGFHSDYAKELLKSSLRAYWRRKYTGQWIDEQALKNFRPRDLYNPLATGVGVDPLKIVETYQEKGFGPALMRAIPGGGFKQAWEDHATKSVDKLIADGVEYRRHYPYQYIRILSFAEEMKSTAEDTYEKIKDVADIRQEYNDVLSRRRALQREIDDVFAEVRGIDRNAQLRREHLPGV